MRGNIFGERFVVVSFGESHGRCVGVVVDGCPAGLRLEKEDIQRDLDLRRPSNTTISTSRKEEDEVEILSGVFKGHTTGAPICALVWNRDVRSEDYEEVAYRPRPSHADYYAHIKYGGFNDYRGGGRFSGRITAGFVIAGAIAKKLLLETLGIEVVAYVLEIGGVRAEEFTLEDARKFRYLNEVRAPTTRAAEKMRDRIIEARGRGDSVGGVIECVAVNLPIGLGEPVFDTLDGDLAKALMAIPGARGVEFGAGFRAAAMTGSQHNDPLAIRDGIVVSEKNDAGGVVGGLSTGMPLVMRVAFKPPSSIALKQKTVDLREMREVEFSVPGRHDACIVPRAVPVVEAMVAITLADHAIRAGLIPPVLKPRGGDLEDPRQLL
ncbi:MAG: chorismate synthase [Nitrososphaeria archaeon]|nr:chorismate synthase [Aigarchaeota archaeon]MCX8187703.1 chorismate synthase [Nitrososphaeria archaeon]MDW8021159.1 chorismate synthase [Nitrososphaerota archaeon]